MEKELGGSLLHWACIVNSAVDRSFSTIVKARLDLVLYLLGEENIHVNMRSRVDQSTPLMVRDPHVLLTVSRIISPSYAVLIVFFPLLKLMLVLVGLRREAVLPDEALPCGYACGERR